MLLETAYNFRNGLTGDNRIQPLSTQYLVDCSTSSKGCQGGFPDRALMSIQGKGIPNESDYPYKGFQYKSCGAGDKDGERDWSKNMNEKIINLKKYGFQGCGKYGYLKVLFGTCNKTKFYNLLEEGPCTVVIDTEMSEYKYYQSGIIDITKSDNLNHADSCKIPTHAVMAYAWKHQKDVNGTIKEYIQIRNSWGNRWGENGDFRIFFHGRSETCFVTTMCVQPNWA
jgi:hypothetical protein